MSKKLSELGFGHCYEEGSDEEIKGVLREWAKEHIKELEKIEMIVNPVRHNKTIRYAINVLMEMFELTREDLK